MDLAFDQSHGGDRRVEMGTRDRAQHPDENAQGEDRAHHVQDQDDSGIAAQEGPHDAAADDGSHEHSGPEVLREETARHGRTLASI